MGTGTPFSVYSGSNGNPGNVPPFPIPHSSSSFGFAPKSASQVSRMPESSGFSLRLSSIIGTLLGQSSSLDTTSSRTLPTALPSSHVSWPNSSFQRPTKSYDSPNHAFWWSCHKSCSDCSSQRSQASPAIAKWRSYQYRWPARNCFGDDLLRLTFKSRYLVERQEHFIYSPTTIQPTLPTNLHSGRSGFHGQPWRLFTGEHQSIATRTPSHNF